MYDMNMKPLHDRSTHSFAWVVSALRAAPVLAAGAWLCFYVIQYGPIGHNAMAGKLALVVCSVTVALGLASGVYDPTRTFRQLRARLRRHTPIDWSAFDAARTDWERWRH